MLSMNVYLIPTYLRQIPIKIKTLIYENYSPLYKLLLE